jgi:hypothetical protein
MMPLAETPTITARAPSASKALVQGNGIGGGAAALEIIREQDRIAQRRRREDQRLGGLATTAAGVGLLIFLRFIVPTQPVYLVGLIPLLVGVALLAHTLLFAPKE